MRIVKLSDLSEKEKNEILQQQNTRIKQNISQSQMIRKKSNNDFNTLLGNKTISASQNLPLAPIPSKNVKREKNNDIFDTVGKTIENGWLGLKNGIKSSVQTIGRAITDTHANRADVGNNINKKVLEKLKEKHPEEKEEIERVINNPILSGEQIRKESKEAYKKIDNEKIQNQEKIQKNTEDIKNPIAKYLAGNIAPAIGQMTPRNIGWTSGDNLFYFICYWKLL